MFGVDPLVGITSRKKYLSDEYEHRKRMRLDVKPPIRVLLERWDEWEQLRFFVRGMADANIYH